MSHRPRNLTATTADISEPFDSDRISDLEAVYFCLWSDLSDCAGTLVTADLSYVGRLD